MSDDHMKYLFPLLAILAGATVSLVTFYFWRKGREWRLNGVTSAARVVRKYRKPGEGLENCYAVVVYAGAGNAALTAEVNVHSRSWHGLREGKTVSVTYLANQQNAVRYGSRASLKFQAALLVFIVAAGAAMALLGVGSLVAGLVGILQ